MQLLVPYYMRRSQRLRIHCLMWDPNLPKTAFIYFSKKLLKMMKNAFCSIFKALFVLKIYVYFCLDCLVRQKKRLGQKDTVNFEIHNLVNKKLQYKYCSLSQEVKEICSILVMLKKGLGIVSPPHFVNDFSRKMCIVLYLSYWPNFIV